MGDLKVSVRHLLKTPGFTLAAIVVLALGIGLNAGMFSVVYALTMAGRAFPEPDRVVQLYSRDPAADRRLPRLLVSRSTRSSPRAATCSAASSRTIPPWSGSATASSRAARSRRSSAPTTSTCSACRCCEGRTFTAEEDRPGQDIPVVVASYAHWQRTGFDPALVGQDASASTSVSSRSSASPRAVSPAR